MSLKSVVQHHLGDGVATALARLRSEFRILLLHRRSIRKARKMVINAPLKLNCGSGPYPKAGWINIDLSKNADLHLDLRAQLPFPDNSVSIIYSEHFFEHLENPSETSMFLRESLRVLVPGGQFRVGVPDTEWPLTAYAKGDDSHFQFVRRRWNPAHCETKMDIINYHFRQGTEHKYSYDFETLAKVLSQAGFVRIERTYFDPLLDSEHRREGTLYVNAFKKGQ